MTKQTPAGDLVRAFGNPEAMVAMYAPDVEWWLPPSIDMFPRPMKGKDTLEAFHKEIWTKHYRPDCKVTIQDETGDDRCSAVRFIYRAHVNATNSIYENEYTVFVRSSEAGITHVFEAMDTVVTFKMVAGES